MTLLAAAGLWCAVSFVLATLCGRAISGGRPIDAQPRRLDRKL